MQPATAVLAWTAEQSQVGHQSGAQCPALARPACDDRHISSMMLQNCQINANADGRCMTNITDSEA